MYRLFFSIFLIISILIYLNCPNGYSIEFCSLIAGIYVFQSFFYINKVNNFGFLSFETFFLFSFFLACFAYPVFFYNINLRNFSNINENIINKSTALSLVGANSYMLGSMLILKINKSKINIQFSFESIFLKKNINKLILISFVLFSLFFYFGGLTYIEAYRDINNPNLKSSLEYLNLIKIIFIVCSLFVFLTFSKSNNFFDLIVKVDKRYLFLYFPLFLILLVGGTRNLPIQMLLTVLFLYNLIIKKISIINVLLIVTVGFVFFTTLRKGREDFSNGKNAFSGEISIDNDEGSSAFFSDFLVSSATLYVLVEEVNVKGISYGKSMVLPVLSIVPYLQSFTILLLNLDLNEISLSSSIVATDLIFGSDETGAGTNLIGDLYFSFGFLGVIIGMFLLGYFIANITNRIIDENNAIALLAYLCMFSVSFFIVRVEITYFIRTLTWSFFIFKILDILNKRNLD